LIFDKKLKKFIEPYFSIILAYDLILENHPMEYFVRVEFSRKQDVISNERDIK
jgi:hypothetical protein